MTKGILKYVNGDVTNPQKTAPNEIAVIVHVCNDLGIIGAGVALALKKKWAKVEEAYIKSNYVLGSVSYACITENNEINTVIANMVAQKGVVGFNNSKPIKYQYLVECMQKVFNFCDAMKIDNALDDKDVVIHAPKFGSDLAQGTWGFIEELIQEMWVDRGLDVIIYEFKE